MRNFMCIFLVVLLNQNVSRGLDCSKTEYEGHCIDQYLRNRQPGYHEKALSCLQALKERKEECTESKDTCVTVIFEYVDNDTLTFTDCDASQDNFRRCKYLMRDVMVGVANKELKSKDCKKCKTNMCNRKTKKVETTTILSKQNNAKAPAKETNKSNEIHPSIAVLIFLCLIPLVFQSVDTTKFLKIK